MSGVDAVPLCRVPMLVAISDFQDGWPPADVAAGDPAAIADAWRDGRLGPPPGCGPGRGRAHTPVRGGYLERLPLACIRRGLVDHAEIWHHWRPADPGPCRRDDLGLVRRGFHLDDGHPPFRSSGMLGFVQAFGAPQILCVWGLGVDTPLLDACQHSFKIYNSIDVPALRVPEAVSAHFDLVLTGAEWQSEAVRARHPGMACAVMPIGPEFADPDTFRPLGLAKRYDVIYVAAAQAYKRHDILFDALAGSPRRLKALCVFGYGDMGGPLRDEAAARGLDVEFVGPPGVGFDEVNRLMNLARVGVVCGSDDGAPAILTEYMLAGLPVLANARLRCGLHYITPATGRIAEPDGFRDGLLDLLSAADDLEPRAEVLARWTWPHTMRRLEAVFDKTRKGRALRLRQDATSI